MGKMSLIAVAAFATMSIGYGVTRMGGEAQIRARSSDYQYNELARIAAVRGFNVSAPRLADNFADEQIHGMAGTAAYGASTTINGDRAVIDGRGVGQQRRPTGQRDEAQGYVLAKDP